MVEKRFEAVCELGKAPYLVDYSAKYVKSNGVELTIKRTFEGDYDVESSDSDCIYFANLLNALHEDLETHKQYCKTLGIGINKIMQSIKDDREDKALVMCLTLLKKLEEEELLE